MIAGPRTIGAVDDRCVADSVCSSSIRPNSCVANLVVGPAIVGDGGITDSVIGTAV